MWSIIARGRSGAIASPASSSPEERFQRRSPPPPPHGDRRRAHGGFHNHRRDANERESDGPLTRVIGSKLVPMHLSDPVPHLSCHAGFADLGSATWLAAAHRLGRLPPGFPEMSPTGSYLWIASKINKTALFYKNPSLNGTNYNKK